MLADRLEVAMLDLFTFPDEDPRHHLIDATRKMTKGTIRRLVKDAAKPE